VKNIVSIVSSRNRSNTLLLFYRIMVALVVAVLVVYQVLVLTMTMTVSVVAFVPPTITTGRITSITSNNMLLGKAQYNSKKHYSYKNNSGYNNINKKENCHLLFSMKSRSCLFMATDDNADNRRSSSIKKKKNKNIVIIGSGWGGLSAAHNLIQSKSDNDEISSITVIDAAPRVGGLVRDGYNTIKNNNNHGNDDNNHSQRIAEAGQHGFWDNYHNIFKLLYNDLKLNVDEEILTGYAKQGQYSPRGLEAIWPIYRDNPPLPTGLAQAVYTRFTRLPLADRLTAFPLILAFSEFDNSDAMWKKYDNVSFRDLCIRLGVSKKCYEEAFEPMILTGLFAPGAECSAAAALGMAYFFVLKSQNSFDVRWCKGNIGDKILEPWVKSMSGSGGDGGVTFLMSTRVVGFREEGHNGVISKVICEKTQGNGRGQSSSSSFELDADIVVFAVGGAALNALVRKCPVLAKHEEFRRFANLRGTGVLATRLYLDKMVDIPYSANACWGFDKGIGQTFFDISKLHAIEGNEHGGGSIIEVDYYHAASLLVMDDESIVTKVKKDLDVMLGYTCQKAQVVDAAIVRLPNAVNWYSPGSYANMPDIQSKSIPNVYFVGDIVKTKHGSWSQEKAYVTGAEAANLVLGRPIDTNIISLSPDELHVAAGKQLVSISKKILGLGDQSFVDFLW